jgi:GNAT superfamily N-acetyltransferase
MLIQPAIPDNLESIVALWYEFIEFHRQHDPSFAGSPEAADHYRRFVAEKLADPNWLVLVAVDETSVVGYCLAAIMERPPLYFAVNRYGFVEDMIVTQQYRRRGVGYLLYDRIEAWLKANKVTRIELRATVANEVSQAFWKRAGFKEFVVTLVKEI